MHLKILSQGRIRLAIVAAFVLLATQSPADAQNANILSLRSKFLAAAIEQTQHKVIYDGSYRRMAYPGGDVPKDRGVCTDVIIRAYRGIGIDLQQRVHEDMKSAFIAYPKLWGMKQPDANIDHRRVPNLQKYFVRQNAQLAVSQLETDYKPGDLVTWMLPGNLPHIGIVVDRDSSGERPLIVHNIGRGPQIEDMLFDYPITGHYRFFE